MQVSTSQYKPVQASTSQCKSVQVSTSHKHASTHKSTHHSTLRLHQYRAEYKGLHIRPKNGSNRVESAHLGPGTRRHAHVARKHDCERLQLPQHLHAPQQLLHRLCYKCDRGSCLRAACCPSCQQACECGVVDPHRPPLQRVDDDVAAADSSLRRGEQQRGRAVSPWPWRETGRDAALLITTQQR